MSAPTARSSPPASPAAPTSRSAFGACSPTPRRRSIRAPSCFFSSPTAPTTSPPSSDPPSRAAPSSSATATATRRSPTKATPGATTSSSCATSTPGPPTARPPISTLWIDCDVEIGLARANKRAGGPGDRFEAEPLRFHEKVRRGFTEIAAAEPRTRASHRRRSRSRLDAGRHQDRGARAPTERRGRAVTRRAAREHDPDEAARS